MTLVRSASSVPTTRYSPNFGRAIDAIPKSSPSAPPFSIEVLLREQPDAPTRPGFLEIDALVDRYQENPTRQIAMEKARNLIGSDTTLGDKSSLKQFRLAKGLSQSNLAAMIGTTQAHVARIESGRYDVQVSTLMRLAGALEVDPTQAVSAFVRSLTLIEVVRS